jgi:hypothetical protein
MSAAGDPLRGPTEPCLYFQQPGHTPAQKPDPSVYAGDPNDWPLCERCRERIEQRAKETLK